MTWKPNKNFKKKYGQLYKDDPIAANLMLLLAELANQKGQIILSNGPDGTSSEELLDLMQARFNDPEEYAL